LAFLAELRDLYYKKQLTRERVRALVETSPEALKQAEIAIRIEGDLLVGPEPCVTMREIWLTARWRLGGW
jgi:hypothetical protein